MIRIGKRHASASRCNCTSSSLNVSPGRSYCQQQITLQTLRKLPFCRLRTATFRVTGLHYECSANIRGSDISNRKPIRIKEQLASDRAKQSNELQSEIYFQIFRFLK